MNDVSGCISGHAALQFLFTSFIIAPQVEHLQSADYQFQTTRFHVILRGKLIFFKGRTF